METLTEDNFIIFAATSYTNPQCTSTDEFYEEINRFKYLRKIFTRYRQSGKIKERLVINHLTVLFNVFELHSCIRMLFFKLEGYWDILKPFLILLSVMPEQIYKVGNHKIIRNVDIHLDPHLVSVLRTI